MSTLANTEIYGQCLIAQAVTEILLHLWDQFGFSLEGLLLVILEVNVVDCDKFESDYSTQRQTQKHFAISITD